MKPLSLWFVLALLVTPAQAQVTFVDETFAYDVQDPVAGAWIGNVSVPQAAGQSFFAGIVVDPAGDERSVILNCIPLTAMNASCSEVEAEGRRLRFTYDMGAVSLRFEGEVNDDGQRMTGTVANLSREDGEGEPEHFEFARSLRATDVEGHMAFTGELDVQTIKIGMSIVLARTPGGNWVGSLDIPMQMLRAFPLINFTENDGTITGELAVPGGASIEMSLGARDQLLTGVFVQSGMRMPFEFTRDHNYAYKEITRPQEPKPPFPYEEREIVVQHPDGFVLAGTLTIPDPAQYGEDPFPTAVLISGSGQQDRNEAILGHKPFLVLADHLTRHGIAVMRYDDRGVGGSGGLDTLAKATSEDFATDTLAVVEHLKSIEAVDASRIGLIGHSEGGLIAPMVGTMTDDIAFMVLMAGPGVPGREVLDVQRRKLSVAAGMSEDDANEQNRVINELIDASFEGATLRELVNRAMEMNETDPDLMTAEMSDDELRTAIRAQMTQIVNPWMQYFLQYDPVDALRQVKCPVLALNGTLDLQVWYEQNLPPIEQTLKANGVDVTVVAYDNYNHLFQKAVHGTVSEYSEIETTIEPDVLEDIATWIIEKVGREG